VTVVIPTFRDAENLRRALESVAAQTRPPAQVVVIDDASGDGSAKAICNSSAIPNLSLIELSDNGGPGRARNAGLAASVETFVAFLDADDEWHAEKLERQIAVMTAPDAAALTFHAKLFNGAAWPDLGADIEPVPLLPRSLLISNVASISTVMVRRDAIRYEFQPSYACEDYWFVAANVLAGVRAARVAGALARSGKQPFGAGGLSGRLYAMQAGEMRVLLALCRAGLIRGWSCSLLLGWSLAKFSRRIVLVAIRNARSAFWRKADPAT
jgi:glycosyltransferase involved in cell wall biosynthesis